MRGRHPAVGFEHGRRPVVADRRDTGADRQRLWGRRCPGGTDPIDELDGAPDVRVGEHQRELLTADPTEVATISTWK
jgi:hypothetical protein